MKILSMWLDIRALKINSYQVHVDFVKRLMA